MIVLIIFGVYVVIGICFAIYLKHKGYLTGKILMVVFLWLPLLIGGWLKGDKWGGY